MPPNSPSLEDAKANLIEHIVKLDAYLTSFIAQLRNAGFTDQRSCAIAYTHFEEGCAAAMRAVRERPSNDYAKTPASLPDPPEFRPRTDNQKNIALTLPIRDHRADGDTWPRDG